MSVDFGDKAFNYFSTISPEASGIIEKIRQCSNESPYFYSLPVEKQEELLDEFFVPQNVKEFYVDAPSLGDLPEMFPKMSMYGGEKMVELDDKTYFRDEFSGPFCWETSSQNEFSFDKIEEMEKPKGYRVPSPKLDKQKEKGKLWQSPFLAKDRSKGMSSEALHLFEKFGMKLEDEDDEESEKTAVLTEISSQNNSYKTDDNDIELDLNENDSSSDSDNSPVTVVEIEKQFSQPIVEAEDNNLDIIETKPEINDSPSLLSDSQIKIDNDSSSSVAKTGFDFLDNW